MKKTYLFFVALFLIALTAVNSWSQDKKITDSGTFSFELPLIDCIGEGPFLEEGEWYQIYEPGEKSKLKVRVHATITNLVTDEVYYLDKILNNGSKWLPDQGSGYFTVFNLTLTDSEGNVIASGQTHGKQTFNANGIPTANFWEIILFPCNGI